MHIKREKLIDKLVHILGEPVVKHSNAAIPELLKMAAVEIFFNCDNDNDLGQTSYIIRMALAELRETGSLTFDQF